MNDCITKEDKKCDKEKCEFYNEAYCKRYIRGLCVDFLNELKTGTLRRRG